MIGISCTKEKLPENVLATVDGQQISISDFKRAYLPVLLYSDKQESPQTREEVLNFLIEQTILAQEARSLELDTIPTLDVLRRAAEKTAFTRILYKEWVKDLVTTPSEATLRSAFQKSHNPRLVRHLFLSNKSDADRIYHELASGANWDSLAALTFKDEYLAENGGVLGWMKFGEMDPAFETAVYDLELNEISQPIQTKFGWHLIRVDNQSRELLLTEYDYSMERRRLIRLFRERQEKHLADSVVNARMQAAALEFHPEFAPQVWTILRDQMRQLVDPGEFSEIETPEVIHFSDRLAPLLDKEMLRFSGEVWTVGDFVARLPEMNRELMLNDVKTATAFLVRDELIHREGVERGLDKRADVLGEIADRENQFLSNLYLRYKADNTPLSDQTIRNYYEKYASTKYQTADSIYIHELIFSDLDQAQAFKANNQNTFDISTLDAQSAKLSLNTLGWFRGARVDRADYYHRLVNLPIKTLVGPLGGKDGPVLIVASNRHRHTKAYENIIEQVKFDAENDRNGKLRLREVQRLAPNKKIDIEIDKLHSMDWLN